MSARATDDEHRRLLSRAVRTEEDAAELRARLAAAYQEIAEVRALVPGARSPGQLRRGRRRVTGRA